MQEKTAQRIADVVLGAAALGALIFVVRTPALRRLALGLGVSALTGAMPEWITRETRQAWSESAPREI